MPLSAVDLFCGAGGFTTGAEAAGVNVLLAVNHWRTAVYTHQDNHPNTRHICARIDDIDPRHDKTIPEFDLLLASPECTHHSIARGGRPIDDQKRATPWHVCVWAEAKRPRWLCIENVREFRDWGPLDERGRPIASRRGETFRAWIQAIESIGYQVDHQVLNAADFGAPTRRHRLFIVARRGRSRRDIPWPEPSHAGRWRAAAEIIDWAKPCPSIFTRKRPLAEKTLRRIEIGLKKFVGPFAVTLRRNMDGRSLGDPLPTITAGAEHHGLCIPFQMKAIGRNPGATKSILDPLPTIVAARENHAIVVPYLTQYHNGPDGERRNYDPGEPLPTLDTQNRYGLVSPFLVPHFGERDGQEPRTHGVESPLPTVTGQGAGSLVAPYLLAINHGGDHDRSCDVREPLRTLTAKNGHSLVMPFLTKYYGTGSVQPVTEPLDTVTARDRFGLAMVSLIQTMQELGVVDIGFRMLDAAELAAAQGFPAGYSLHGNKAEQVRQIGNAVCPPVAEALCRTLAEAA